MTINVNPKPFVQTINESTCSGAEIVITPGNGNGNIIPTGITYSWSSPTSDPIGTVNGGNSKTGEPTIKQTLFSTVNTSIIAKYIVTPSINNSCVGNPFQVNITVNPKPSIALINKTICSGETFTIKPENVGQDVVPQGTKYTWTVVSNPSILGSNNESNLQEAVIQTLTNTSNIVKTITYKVQPKSGLSGDCIGNEFTINVTVNPIPTLTNDLSKLICNKTSPLITLVADIPSSFAWYGSQPNIPNVEGVSVTNNNTNTIDEDLENKTTAKQNLIYSVTPTSIPYGCLGLTKNITITIMPQVIITSTNEEVICSGGLVNKVLTANLPSTFEWGVKVMNTNVTGGSLWSKTGTFINDILFNTSNVSQILNYSLLPTSIEGNCVGSYSALSILVSPPLKLLNEKEFFICSDNSLNIELVANLPSDFKWYASDPNALKVTGASAILKNTNTIDDHLTLKSSVKTDQIIYYTVFPTSSSSGCTGTGELITVHVSPTPIIANATIEICSGETFNFDPSTIQSNVAPASTKYTYTVTPSVSINGESNNTTGVSVISQTLSNNTNSAQTITYTVKPKCNNCEGLPFTINVLVNPKPSVNSIDLSLCSGELIDVLPTNGLGNSIPSGTKYTWTVPTSVSIENEFDNLIPEDRITQLIKNNTNIEQLVTYTVTPVFGTGGICSGNPFQINVTLRPTPSIKNENKTLCATGNVDVLPLNGNGNIVPNGTKYSWTAPISNPVGIITGVSSQTNQLSFSQSLSNITTSFSSINYIVTPSFLNCVGQSFNIEVTVNPKPYVSNSVKTICSGESIMITPVDGNGNRLPNGTNYTWTSDPNPNVTGITSNSVPLSSFSQTLVNISSSQQNVIYYITPSSGNNGLCNGEVFTVVIQVKPKPKVANLIKQVCSEEELIIVPTDGNGNIVPSNTTFTWQVNSNTNLSGQTDGVNPNNQFIQTITNNTLFKQNLLYTITPVADNCLGNLFFLSVDVNPKSDIKDKTLSVCSAERVSFAPSKNTPNRLPLDTKYKWTVVSNIDVQGETLESIPQDSLIQTLVNFSSTSQLVQYEVTPITGNCSGTPFKLDITVNPKPIYTNVEKTICSGETFDLTPINGGNNIIPTGTKFIWSVISNTNLTGYSNNSSPIETIHTSITNISNTVQQITYTVTPISGNTGSCIGTPFTIILTVKPKPSISNKELVVCSGENFVKSFTNGSGDIVPTNTVYSWAIPTYTNGLNGGLARTNQNQFSGTLTNTSNEQQTATYTITAKAEECVSSSSTILVKVNPKPQISPLVKTVCSESELNFTPIQVVGDIVPDGTMYSWTVDNNSNVTGQTSVTSLSPSFVQTLTNTTNIDQILNYTLKPIYENVVSCAGTNVILLVTVKPKPKLVNITTSVCTNEEFTITPSNGNGNVIPSGINYSWPVPTVTGTVSGGTLGNSVSEIKQTLINSSNTTQVASYIITSNANGCIGNLATLNVSVNPRPIVTDEEITICSGEEFEFQPINKVGNTLPSGTLYKYSVVSSNTVEGENGSNIGVQKIIQTLVNRTNSLKQLIYTITPISGNCIGVPFLLKVNVKPKPELVAISKTICSGEIFTINPTDGGENIIPTNTEYTWVVSPNSSVSGINNNGTPSSSISGTLTNLTNVQQTVNYTVTPLINGTGNCSGNQFSLTVIVNPTPKFSKIISTICSGESFDIIPTNGNGSIIPQGTVYTWNSPTVTAGVTGQMAKTNQTSISGNLVNSSVSVQTATYLITASSNSCINSTLEAVISINPKPIFTSRIETICSGSEFNLNLTPLLNEIIPASTMYTWTVASNSNVTGQSDNLTKKQTVNQTLVNTSSIDQIVNYTVRPIFENQKECLGATFSLLVTVKPTPQISNITSRICSGDELIISPISSNTEIVPSGIAYSWANPIVTSGLTGGLNGANQTEIKQILVNSSRTNQYATYVINSSANGCNGNTFTMSVEVQPKPFVLNKDITICSRETFNYQPQNGNGNIVPIVTTYTWNVQSNVSVEGESNSTGPMTNISQQLINKSNSVQIVEYLVTPLSGNCSGIPFVLKVTVNPSPDISNSAIIICSGEKFSYEPVHGGLNNVPSNTMYTWNVVPNSTITGFNNNTNPINKIEETLINTTNTVQTLVYQITPISGISGNCIGLPFNLSVQVKPTPSLLAQQATICANGSFEIIPTNGNGNIIPIGTIYSWSIPIVTGNISTGIAKTNQVKITGTHSNSTNIQQTASYSVIASINGCSSTPVPTIVTVNPKPSIVSINQTICSGEEFTITPSNGGSNIVPDGTLYTWTVSTNSNVTGQGASNTASSSINQTLVNTSLVSQSIIYTVTPKTGTQDVCIGNPFTVTLVIKSQPIISNLSSVVCSGDLFDVSPPTTGNLIPSGTTYSWPMPVLNIGITGGEAKTNQNTLSNTLVNSSNVNQLAIYTVTPTSNGCDGSQFIFTVDVNPVPLVLGKTVTICSGETVNFKPIQGNGNIIPANIFYKWSVPSNINVDGELSDNSGQSMLSQTLVNNSNTVQSIEYIITPITGQCSGLSCKLNVSINPKPTILNITKTICSGSSFDITPTHGGLNLIPSNTMYTWDVLSNTNVSGYNKNTTPSVNISETLNNLTNTDQLVVYTVTPISGAAGNCVGNSFTITILVKSKPIILPQTYTICSGETFELTPTNGNGNIIPQGINYSWNSPTVSTGVTGGLGNSDQTKISGLLYNSNNNTQTANYQVTPSSNGCIGNVFELIVSINQKPKVASTTLTICSGEAFTVLPSTDPTNVLPTGTSYSWNVSQNSNIEGQSDVSSSQPFISQTLINKSNIEQLLTYNVTPKSGNNGGCSGNVFTIKVNVKPTPKINDITSTICSGNPFSITPNSLGNIIPSGTSYSWAAPVVNGGITGGVAKTDEISINGTLNNPSNSSQTATYNVKPRANTCEGSIFSLRIEVLTSTIIANETITICSDEVFSFDPKSKFSNIVSGDTKYTWIVNSNVLVDGESNNASASSVISQHLVNTSNEPQILTYTVSPIVNNCTGLPFTISVVVNPKPLVIDIDQIICSDLAFSITPINGNGNILPNGTKYTWSVISNPSISDEYNNFTPSFTIGQVLTNTTNSEQIVNYIVTPISGANGNCVGNTFRVNVKVKPTPVLVSQTITACTGSQFTISPTNGNGNIIPNSTLYSWINPSVTGGMTGGILRTNQASIAGNFNNSTSDIQVATYTVTPSVNGCIGLPSQMFVNINPKPLISTQFTSICSGETFSIKPVNDIDNIVPNVTLYKWVVGSNSSITGQNNGNTYLPFIEQTLVNSSNSIQNINYTVTPTYDDLVSCEGKPFSLIVSVKPKPQISGIHSTTCTNEVFSVTPPIMGNILPLGTSYSWNKPNLAVGLIGGVAKIDQDDINDVLNNPSNITKIATYIVTPKSDECIGDKFIVSIDVMPKAKILSEAINICSGESFVYIPKNTNGNVIPNGTKYTWNVISNLNVDGEVSEGNATTNLSQTIINNTNTLQVVSYNVTPVTDNCQGNTFVLTVTVNPRPKLIEYSETICSGNQIIIAPINNNTNIVPDNTTYKWNVGLNSNVNGYTNNVIPSLKIQETLFNLTNINQSITYNITAISGLQGNCESTPFKVTVNVKPKPLVVDQEIMVCSGELFTVAPIDGSGNIVPIGTLYSWTNPTVSGGIVGGISKINQSAISGQLSQITDKPQTATYIVTPIANGCKGSPFNTVVTLNHKPIINRVNVTVCSGQSFDGTPSALGNILPVGTTYTWIVTPNSKLTGFNDVSTPTDLISQTLVNKSNILQSITYLVTPISGEQGGCVGVPFKLVVSVKPTPTIIDQNTTVCSNNKFEVVLVNDRNNIVPNSTLYSWDIPYITNGIIGGTANTNQTNINDILNNSTSVVQNAVYTVIPSANGCIGEPFVVYVDVNPLPELTIQTVYKTCSKNQFSVPLQSNIPSTFSWFAINNTTVVGETFITQNTSTISEMLVNPKSTPEIVNYTIKLTSVNGSCSVVKNIAITVNPLPIPEFRASANKICEGDEVTFYNVSDETDTYLWNFGDGVVSTEYSPSHIYENIFGVINAKLIAYNQYDCTDSMISKITIKNSPELLFDQEEFEGCPSYTVDFIEKLGDADKYFWNFGLPGTVPTTAYGRNQKFVYSEPGIYKVFVTASNSNGCFKKDTLTVTVYPRLNSDFKITSNNKCEVPFSPVIVNNSTGADSYKWIADNAVFVNSNPSEFIPKLEYNSMGNFDISLIITSQYGCSDTSKQTISTGLVPKVDFIASETKTCVPSNIIFNNTIKYDDGSKYEWDFGDGETSNNPNKIDHQYVKSGCYNVSLKITSPDGCVSSKTNKDMVCVYDLPVADFVVDSAQNIFDENSVAFKNNSYNSYKYTWDFGDNTISNATNPLHQFNENKNYLVTLYSYNEAGCSDSITKKINLKKDIYYYIPNSFTPTNDNINETFKPIFCSYFYPSSYKFMIFNRWGDLIFEDNQYNSNADLNAWDGKDFKTGKECQDGTYTWVLRYEMSVEEQFESDGQIFLEGQIIPYEVKGHVNLLGSH